MGEHDLEVSQIDLRLLAGRRLETDLESGRSRRPELRAPPPSGPYSHPDSPAFNSRHKRRAVRAGKDVIRPARYGLNGSMMPGCGARGLYFGGSNPRAT
jgi:hypothetical protein